MMRGDMAPMIAPKGLAGKPHAVSVSYQIRRGKPCTKCERTAAGALILLKKLEIALTSG
jgi:hypothetical protein